MERERKYVGIDDYKVDLIFIEEWLEKIKLIETANVVVVAVEHGNNATMEVASARC